MCTCCITWWPRHPVFCWIEHSRHSRAVVGYVTSWAHASLYVSWRLSGDTTWGSFIKTGEHPLHSSANLELWPLHPPPRAPLSRQVVVFFSFLNLLSPALSSPDYHCKKLFWWHSGPDAQFFLLPVCPSRSRSGGAAPLLLGALPMCKWFAQVFSATLHRPPSSCCLSLHNVWLYLSCWFLPALMRISGKKV